MLVLLVLAELVAGKGLGSVKMDEGLKLTSSEEGRGEEKNKVTAASLFPLVLHAAE